MKYNFQTRTFEDVEFIVNGITVFGKVDDTGILWIGHDDNNNRYVIRNTGNNPKIVINGDFIPSATVVFNPEILFIIDMGYMEI